MPGPGPLALQIDPELAPNLLKRMFIVPVFPSGEETSGLIPFIVYSSLL